VIDMVSIILPVFNAEKTMEAAITKVISLPVEKEVVVVDDCSKDKTPVILSSSSFNALKVIHHASNRGKAAAVRTGVENARGEFLIVLDVNSGFDFNNYLKLLEAAKDRGADVVLGFRFSEVNKCGLSQKADNCLAAFLLNMIFCVKLNDWFTDCWLIRRESFLKLLPKLKKFDTVFELLKKALRSKMRVIEVPIAYDFTKN